MAFFNKSLIEMLTSPFMDDDEELFNEPEDLNPEENEDRFELPNSEEIELPRLDKYYNVYSIDFNTEFKNIKHLVKVYREVARHYEIDDAIDEIVDEAITLENNKHYVEIDLDDIKTISQGIKTKIEKEYEQIVKILNFKRQGSELFRKWYIDGRLWFQVLFDSNEKNGINKIRLLSPLDITRVKKGGRTIYLYKEDEENRQKRSNINFMREIENREYQEGLEISERNIVFVPSGLTDPENNYYISYLDKSIKPLNQLKLLEDSAVIYRITRAPERRVFYIDVGKLPKTKAENYVRSLMNKFKSTITYDTTTGKVTNNKKVMTMLEDFYLPTRGDSKGTKIETLQGGQQLGEIEDLRYFKKKLLKSMKVPYSRLDTEENAVVQIGRSGELTRPELKFQKFIHRLKNQFSVLFLELLKIQLISKNIISISEWNNIKNDINFIWAKDSYFEELKELDILNQRLEILDSIGSHVGVYFSKEWVKKNVLKQSDKDIKEMQKQMDADGSTEEAERDDEVENAMMMKKVGMTKQKDSHTPKNDENDEE